MRSRSEISFRADDGANSKACGYRPEVVGAEHVAMVSDGNRRHFLLYRGTQKLLDSSGAIEHREFGMDVQMNE
jgi:hypothetical protein